MRTSKENFIRGKVMGGKLLARLQRQGKVRKFPSRSWRLLLLLLLLLFRS